MNSSSVLINVFLIFEPETEAAAQEEEDFEEEEEDEDDQEQGEEDYDDFDEEEEEDNGELAPAVAAVAIAAAHWPSPARIKREKIDTAADETKKIIIKPEPNANCFDADETSAFVKTEQA